MKSLVSVEESDSFEYIARLMTETGIRRVIVTGEEVTGVMTSRV